MGMQTSTATMEKSVEIPKTTGNRTALLLLLLLLLSRFSRVQLFVAPRIAACQASLSITNSLSSLKLMSIESVMPSSHLIMSSPSPLASNPSQHQSLFQ